MNQFTQTIQNDTDSNGCYGWRWEFPHSHSQLIHLFCAGRVRVVHVQQAAISTLAVLHPWLCGCMKYTVWEEVGRWGNECRSVPEVRYSLQLLMLKSVSQSTWLLKVSLPAAALPLSSTCFHFCTPLCLKSFHLCSGPLCCCWSLRNLRFQLVLRKSLFDSHTPTQAALLLLSLSSPLPHHFHRASSISFAFVLLPCEKTHFMSELWQKILLERYKQSACQNRLEWAGTLRMGLLSGEDSLDNCCWLGVQIKTVSDICGFLFSYKLLRFIGWA